MGPALQNREDVEIIRFLNVLEGIFINFVVNRQQRKILTSAACFTEMGVKSRSVSFVEVI